MIIDNDSSPAQISQGLLLMATTWNDDVKSISMNEWPVDEMRVIKSVEASTLGMLVDDK